MHPDSSNVTLHAIKGNQEERKPLLSASSAEGL
jgi:hypothetical protein